MEKYKITMKSGTDYIVEASSHVDAQRKFLEKHPRINVRNIRQVVRIEKSKPVEHKPIPQSYGYRRPSRISSGRTPRKRM